MYQRYFKRLFDFVFSFLALICLSPFLFCVYLLLLLTNKGDGAFFLQERPGKDGKIFKVLKFRTMNNKRDEGGNLLLDTLRITPVGRFIRRTSIDELPQLFNVLMGDMSFIGPRPLLVKYLSFYSQEQMRRHAVRPGITGWAQCHGRNALSWTERFKYDVWYVDNLSLLIDIKIILISVKSVLFREGIITGKANVAATMEEFNGKN